MGLSLNSKINLPFVVLVILNLWDACLTSLCIFASGSTMIEVNPVMKFLIDEYGIASMFLLKGAILLLFAYLIDKLDTNTAMYKTLPTTLWLMNSIYAAIVLLGFHTLYIILMS